MAPFAVHPGLDEELTFRTYRGYLEAAQMSISSLYPHPSGSLAGVARAVGAGAWRPTTPTGSALSVRAAEYLRNAWGTEILLNAPAVVGGSDFLRFANHWAVVQAYYAIFEAFSAMLLVSHPNPPRTHTALLRWAANQAGTTGSPFVAPWSWRVEGPRGSFAYLDFPAGFRPTSTSSISTVTPANAADHLAQALKTTRDRQIKDRKNDWLKGRKTKDGRKKLQRLPTAEVSRLSGAMAPTTLFDLLYRLRIRSNYDEADAFLTGAVSSADAEAFHAAISEVVAATLLTVELYLAHRVGKTRLELALNPLTIPSSLRSHSVVERIPLW